MAQKLHLHTQELFRHLRDYQFKVSAPNFIRVMIRDILNESIYTTEQLRDAVEAYRSEDVTRKFYQLNVGADKCSVTIIYDPDHTVAYRKPAYYFTDVDRANQVCNLITEILDRVKTSVWKMNTYRDVIDAFACHPVQSFLFDKDDGIDSISASTFTPINVRIDDNYRVGWIVDNTVEYIATSMSYNIVTDPLYRCIDIGKTGTTWTIEQYIHTEGQPMPWGVYTDPLKVVKFATAVDRIVQLLNPPLH